MARPSEEWQPAKVLFLYTVWLGATTSTNAYARDARDYAPGLVHDWECVKVSGPEVNPQKSGACTAQARNSGQLVEELAAEFSTEGFARRR